MLTAGARLGPYEVLSVLGAGAMGEVYGAQDTLCRTVAIKILPHDKLADADRKARFCRKLAASALTCIPTLSSCMTSPATRDGLPRDGYVMARRSGSTSTRALPATDVAR
jgi:serine/threonine protein kinase